MLALRLASLVVVSGAGPTCRAPESTFRFRWNGQQP
jgi:hypothetical protein